MPGIIPIQNVLPVLTSAIVSRYDELASIKVDNLLRSFFVEKEVKVRYPMIDVRRGSEKVAVDVVRGGQGVRTQITKSTLKSLDPFYYKYSFDATEMDAYWRVYGSEQINVNDMAELANGIAKKQKANTDMIERAIELHCATIFESGTVVSLRDGSILDYKRKAGSMVDPGSGNYWDNSGVDPYVQLRAGADFLRATGKAQGYIINVLCGIQAWQAFRNNPKVQEKLKQFNNRRDTLQPAQMTQTGGVYQGEVDTDGYLMRFWTYNEGYEHPTTGVFTPYLNPKKVVLVAENPEFELIYAAVPQVVQPGTNTSSLAVGKFIYKNFVNEEEGYHRFYQECSPLPVPMAIDRIYTLTALGA